MLLGTAFVGPALAVPANAALETRLSQVVQDAPGPVGVSMACGNPARIVEAGATTQLRATSTLKLAIAFAAAIAGGVTGPQLSSNSTFTAAISQSDNSAANDLLTQAGGGSSAAGVDKVNALFESLGMHQTHLDGPYRAGPGRSQKVTTARDLRLLAQATAQLASTGNGPLADAGATPSQAKALTSLMEQSDYPGLIAPAVGSRGTTAHKPGWLDDIKNDLAIVTLDDGTRCSVGIVTEGMSLSAAQAVGAQVVNAVMLPLAAPSVSPARQATTTTPTTSVATVEAVTLTSATVSLPEIPAAEQQSSINWWWWVVGGIAVVLVVLIIRQIQLWRRQRQRKRARWDRYS